MSDNRLKRAARNWWDSLERQRWERGTIGRLNADGSYTVRDETRPGFVHVRMDSGSMTIARDVGKVQLRATLPVRMRREAGVLILDSEDTSGLLEGDTGEPSNDYGVPAHPISIHTDVDIDTPTTGQALVYDGTNWVNDTVTADVGAAIEAAAAKTTPVDDDDLGITDSAASNALKKLSFANLATWVMGKIAALTAKTTPVGSDSFVITDSAASDAPKRLTITNFGVYLATSLNLLYGRLAVANTWLANNAFNSIATSGSALSVTRDLAAASTDAPVVSVVQDNAGDDQAAMRVQQDGTGDIAQFLDGATEVFVVEDGGKVVMRRSTGTGALLDLGTLTLTEGANTFPTGFWRSADNVVLLTMIRLATTDTMMGAGVDGETFRRFLARVDGALFWGSGSGAVDTNLYRNAANQLKTDDDFVVAGDVAIGTDAPPAGHIFNASADGAAAFLSAISYGAFDSGFAFYGPRGTLASPSANQSGDPLGSIYFGGWDTALSNGARIYAIAAGDWGSGGDSSDNPTDVRIATVPDGSGTLVDRVAITSNGNVGIGTTAPQGKLDVAGNFLTVNKTGVVGSEVTVLTAGSVTKGIRITGDAYFGAAGGRESLNFQISLPGAGSSVIVTGGVFTTKLYSTGQLVVFRSSGAETYHVVALVIYT